MELVPIEFSEETIHSGRFKRKVASESVVNAIDPSLMMDVAAAVIAISVPSPDQKKSLF